MKRHMPNVVLTIAAGVLFGFVAGSVGSNVFAAEDKSETYRMLELFGDVFERVRSDYVEKKSDEELIEAAIEGMLVSLDPHSTFLNKRKFRDMQVQTRGEFGGLGIEVTMEKGYVKVVSPIDETPAARAGLRSGDLITHLDGDPVQGLSLSQAVEKMRGPIKTDITLTIRRATEKPFDVSITRDKIRIQSVRSRAEGKVGYIRITSFSEQTDKGLKKAVDRVNKEARRRRRGLRPRSAQQPRRAPRPGGDRQRQLPGAGRNRLDPRPSRGSGPALQRDRPATYARRQADGCADQRRLRVRRGNCRRRVAGPSPRGASRHQDLRQRVRCKRSFRSAETARSS